MKKHTHAHNIENSQSYTTVCFSTKIKDQPFMIKITL